MTTYYLHYNGSSVASIRAYAGQRSACAAYLATAIKCAKSGCIIGASVSSMQADSPVYWLSLGPQGELVKQTA